MKSTLGLIIGAALVFGIGDGFENLALRADASLEIAVTMKCIVTMIGGMVLGKAFL